jgi:hypothetical protein
MLRFVYRPPLDSDSSVGWVPPHDKNMHGEPLTPAKLIRPDDPQATNVFRRGQVFPADEKSDLAAFCRSHPHFRLVTKTDFPERFPDVAPDFRIARAIEDRQRSQPCAASGK